MILDLSKLFWIGPEKQLFTTEVSNLIYVQTVLDQPKFFGRYEKNNLSLQGNLDLRKPDLRKNFDLRKIVGTTDFLVHKLSAI